MLLVHNIGLLDELEYAFRLVNAGEEQVKLDLATVNFDDRHFGLRDGE